MSAATVRVEDGTFITHHAVDGFRARCACGWAGQWRGLDVAQAYADADEHEAKGCGR